MLVNDGWPTATIDAVECLRSWSRQGRRVFQAVGFRRDDLRHDDRKSKKKVHRKQRLPFVFLGAWQPFSFHSSIGLRGVSRSDIYRRSLLLLFLLFKLRSGVKHNLCIAPSIVRLDKQTSDCPAFARSICIDVRAHCLRAYIHIADSRSTCLLFRLFRMC
jgi:hypothetical protein